MRVFLHEIHLRAKRFWCSIFCCRCYQWIECRKAMGGNYLLNYRYLIWLETEKKVLVDSVFVLNQAEYSLLSTRNAQKFMFIILVRTLKYINVINQFQPEIRLKERKKKCEIFGFAFIQISDSIAIYITKLCRPELEIFIRLMHDRSIRNYTFIINQLIKIKWKTFCSLWLNQIIHCILKKFV